MAPAPPDDQGGYGNYNTSHGLSTVTPPGLLLPRTPPGTGGSAASSLFSVREQAYDGNCLFRSFSDQVYGSPEHHMLVRDRCSKYIANERNYFEQFVAEPFEEFLARMQQPGEWGDDVEIQALSEIYDCRVEIYASYTHTLMRTFHEACDAKWPQPIRLQYVGRAHYNSLALRSGFTPLAKSMAGQQPAPGEIEDGAILRSQKRQAAGQRRSGAGEADVEQTDKEVLDESVRLSRLEFEHRSDEEMSQTLELSRMEWEKMERARMDEEVIGCILEQSVQEEEQKQLVTALQESKAMLAHGRSNPTANGMPAASSSGNEQDTGEQLDFEYPESVYAVMSMGFPLEKCIQAYHLVGDNPEGMLQLFCQSLGR